MNQGGVHEYDRHKPERKTPGKSSARRIRKFIWLLDAGIAWRNGKNRHSPDSPSFQPKLRRVGIFGKSEVPCAFWTDVGRAGNTSPSAKQCCQSDSIAAWSALDLTLHFRIRTFATSVVAKSDRRLCRRRQSRSVHRRLRRRARSRGGRVQVAARRRRRAASAMRRAICSISTFTAISTACGQAGGLRPNATAISRSSGCCEP